MKNGTQGTGDVIILTGGLGGGQLRVLGLTSILLL